MKIKFYLAIIIFSCIGFGLNAQSLSVNYISVSPKGELLQNGFRPMGGIVFDIGGPKISKLSTKAITTNLRGSFEYFSSDNTNEAEEIENFTMPGNDNEVGTIGFSNNSLGLTFGPRFTFNTGTPFIPYADFFGGFRAVSSERYFIPNGKDEDCPEVDNIVSSPLLQAGVSGGLLLRVIDILHLDFRVSYMRGGNVRFINLDSVREEEDNRLLYNVSNSRTTEMLTFQFGIRFRIEN